MGGQKLPIPFANPNTYAGHSGVDYPQPTGTPFRASGAGVVVSRAKNTRGGYYVWVKYDAGPTVGYHHMNSHRDVPSVGTRVSEGTLLGYVGSLGQYSTGPHLHSEVAGHATTDGYWQYFDRNRVVGQTTGGGSAAGKEEDDVTADDVWKYPVRRPEGNVFAIQELADAKTAAEDVRDELAPILRGGKRVQMRQDLVDTGTLVRQVLAEQKATAAALQALATAQGADPLAIQEIVREAVKTAMRDVSFTADVS